MSCEDYCFVVLRFLLFLKPSTARQYNHTGIITGKHRMILAISEPLSSITKNRVPMITHVANAEIMIILTIVLLPVLPARLLYPLKRPYAH